MNIKIGFLVAIVIAITACQSAPQTQDLMNENKVLQEQLAETNIKIGQLEADNRVKQQDIEELQRVLGVLDVEKTSRVQESSVLRGQVRKFVQEQIDSLKNFLVLGDLLDYVGGELVERSLVEEKSIFLVDLANPVPRNGTLTGVGAFITQPSPFVVKILRPAGDQLVVIWESKPINGTSGLNKVNFPVTVGIEKGDYLGYYFPDVAGVTFDEGTSDVRYLTRDVSLGGSIRKSSLLGEAKKRAYSIGAYGLLN
ncbi:hypothetical protein NBRC116493_06450 [Aurantivibrio infirmus]